jgi:hypothetical protein
LPNRPLTDPDVQIFRYLRSSVLLASHAPTQV